MTLTFKAWCESKKYVLKQTGSCDCPPQKSSVKRVAQMRKNIYRIS